MDASPPRPAHRVAHPPRGAAAALQRHLPELAPQPIPRGGLHLWASLPEGTDDVALAAAAAAEGVIVFPGRPWYASEPPAPHLRLTYAAAPPDRMDEAVRRLARALRKARE